MKDPVSWEACIFQAHRTRSMLGIALEREWISPSEECRRYLMCVAVTVVRVLIMLLHLHTCFGFLSFQTLSLHEQVLEKSENRIFKINHESCHERKSL